MTALSAVDDAAARITEARRSGAVVSIMAAGAATVIVIAPPLTANDAADLVTLDDAARTVGHRTTRQLREAIGRGELQAFGSQRSRVVRRADLAAWIESRRVKSHPALDDADLDRRMARLEREQRAMDVVGGAA